MKLQATKIPALLLIALLIAAQAMSQQPVVRDNAHRSPKGLDGRNIALWQSHGKYFNIEKNRWIWQRAHLHQTIEDLYSASYVLDLLVPMLEVSNDKEQSDNIVELYNNSHNLDSIINNCIIGFEYPIDGPEWKRIIEFEIEFNDTASIVSTKRALWPSTKVKLKKQVAHYFKSLLYDLYKNYGSIINEHNVGDLYHISASFNFRISLNLDGKKIKESYNLLDYKFSYKDPFNPQADRIFELILAIKRKIEKDIYKLKDLDYEPEPWITEMFHDEYYEPYNEIKSHNYQ